MLRFNDEYEAEEFCNQYNISVEDGAVVLNRDVFTRTPSLPFLPSQFSFFSSLLILFLTTFSFISYFTNFFIFER